MLSRLRTHFGTAGLVVAIVALIAALGGGAYAATNSGDSGKAATASAKGKQGPRGKTGKTGPAGPAGPAGPQGPAGAPGKDGANGANGANGSNGVTGPTGKTGNNGTAGAQGEVGPTGPTGSFGGEALASGVTETGGWAVSGSLKKVTLKDTNGKEEVQEETVEVGNPFTYGVISFPQRTSFPTTSFLHFRSQPNFADFDEGGPEEIGCKGSPPAPTAPPGHLCVYVFGGPVTGLHELTFSGIGGPPEFGNVGSEASVGLRFAVTGPEAWAMGTWAATGE
jgi:collagen triple helix repeat protein